MKKISNILIPFDFSVCAYRALDYALSFVGESEIEIMLLQVPDEIERDYDNIIDTYSKQLINPIKWIFGKGNLTDIIITATKKEGAEIIIMGTHGLSDTKDNTHTAELVSKTKSTVLVIPDELQVDTIKNITLILGKDEIRDPHELEMLLFIARRFDANVNVLTIKNTPEVYGYSQADKKNETFLEHYLEHFYKNHIYIENKNIVNGVFNYTQNNECDIIAILPNDYTDKGQLSENMLTKELVLKSKLPVLAI